MGRKFDTFSIRKKSAAISETLAETQIHFHWWEGEEKRLKIFREECERMESIAKWSTYTITPKMYWSHNVVVMYNWDADDIKKWVELSIRNVKSITLKKLLSA